MILAIFSQPLAFSNAMGECCCEDRGGEAPPPSLLLLLQEPAAVSKNVQRYDPPSLLPLPSPPGFSIRHIPTTGNNIRVGPSNEDGILKDVCIGTENSIGKIFATNVYIYYVRVPKW